MKTLPIQDSGSKRVGIWIRVSTEDQAAGDSPEHHRIRAEHYCAAKGWKIVELYNLAGVSGKAVSEHSETKRMLADVKRGHIQALVFSKLARLTRNARELMDFSEFFRQHNTDLVSLQENIDTSTPAGRLFYNMVAVFAQWEREEIADRVKSSVAIRAKLGKPLNGKAPFGYTWKDKKLVVHPEEAPIRRLLYELFSEHKRKKSVARILNERGYRTRSGANWSDTTVNWLIADPTAKGLHRSNYTRKSADGRECLIKPESEHIYMPCEPLVSEELWNYCNSLLEKRRTERKAPAKKSVHLFVGYTVCACGAKMYVPSHTPKYICSGCKKNRIPCDDLEEIFIEELKGYLVNPETIRQYVASADEALAEKEELFAVTKHEIERQQFECNQVLKLYKEDAISIEQFKTIFQPADQKRQELEAELPRVQAEIDALKVDTLNEEHLLTEAQNLYERWPTMDREQKRQTVELVTRKITVGQGDIQFDLVRLPSFSSGESTNGQHSSRNTGARSGVRFSLMLRGS
jgi:site-specific DNA recombinase